MVLPGAVVHYAQIAGASPLLGAECTANANLTRSLTDSTISDFRLHIQNLRFEI